MICAIKSCNIHVGVSRETLRRSMRRALRYWITALVSLLFDAGLQDSIMIEDYKPGVSRDDINSLASASDPKYRDTGVMQPRQAMLDYVYYRFEPCMEAQRTIELLLARAYSECRELSSYVRALKNISFHRYDKDSDSSQAIPRHCVQTICSRTSAALQITPERPLLPFDLFYVCMDKSQVGILEELAKAFDFTHTVYCENEVWEVLQRLADDGKERWGPPRYPNVYCLELLLQLDSDGHLLRHEKTFEVLCASFLGLEGGEKAILDYLDHGGRYNFTFEGCSTTALFMACHTGSVQLVERLLDLGADPNRYLTAQEEMCGSLLGYGYDHDAMAVARLLVERGAEFPKMTEQNPGLEFPYIRCIEAGENAFGLFQELGRLTFNDNMDDGNLFDMLHVACHFGEYAFIQEMRRYVKTRVDAIIRDKAALFLQNLLIYLDDLSEGFNDIDTYQMDEAIDTIGLILQLGPRDTLTWSWRLNGEEEYPTALALLKELLTAPENPHLQSVVCAYWERDRYKIYWCLNERIKMEKNSDRSTITILGQRITWPSE